MRAEVQILNIFILSLSEQLFCLPLHAGMTSSQQTLSLTMQHAAE